MSVMEIVLLVAGGLFFAVSFFLPDGRKKEEEKITEEEIQALIDKEMADAKGRIEDMVDETVNYAVEKTERALERLSNEKIMAVDEYSETVLKKINDNHNEAVFLYDMLNDKDEKLKNTGNEIEASKTKLEEEKAEIERVKREEELKRMAEEEALKKQEEEKQKAAEPTFVPFVPKRIELPEDTDDEKAIVKETEKPVIKEAKPSHKAVTRKTPQKSENVEVHFESDNAGRKNSNEMIRRLHEEGKSNMQIAKELGLGVGEVKLVIDLFASRGKSNK